MLLKLKIQIVSNVFSVKGIAFYNNEAHCVTVTWHRKTIQESCVLWKRGYPGAALPFRRLSCSRCHSAAVFGGGRCSWVTCECKEPSWALLPGHQVWGVCVNGVPGCTDSVTEAQGPGQARNRLMFPSSQWSWTSWLNFFSLFLRRTAFCLPVGNLSFLSSSC